VSEADPVRLAPLPRELWDDEAKAALCAGVPDNVGARFLSTGPDAFPPPNALTTLIRHPQLSGPWLAYNAVLLQDPALAPRHRELIVLRVAWRTRAKYEWVQHVRLADRCGITPDEIEAVGRGADDGGWSPLEADLLAATDELLDGYRIGDDTWNRLAQQLDERQLIEVVFVAGTYSCLAMAFNSFGIQLDPELDPTAAPPLPASAG
jgi:alkylhydroperoxidase family enzyme